ncbi:hypothetical protein V1478_002155, partial [Vespula squamosa]
MIEKETLEKRFYYENSSSSTRHDALVYLESKKNDKENTYLLRGEHTLNYMVTVSVLIGNTINQHAGFKGK